MEDGRPPNMGVNQRGRPERLAPGLTLLPKQQACRQAPEPPVSSRWALMLGRRRPQQKDRRTVDGRWLPLCPGHSSWPAACSLTCGGPPGPGLSGLLPPVLGGGKALGGGAGWRQEGRAGSQGYSSLLPVQLSSLWGGACSTFLQVLMCRTVLRLPWMVISAPCESSLCLRSPSEAPERDGSVSGLKHTRPRLSVPRHFHSTSRTSGSTTCSHCLHTGPPVFPPAPRPPVLHVEAASGALLDQLPSPTQISAQP